MDSTAKIVVRWVLIAVLVILLAGLLLYIFIELQYMTKEVQRLETI